MAVFDIHAILEYGLGDYDDTVYPMEVAGDELQILNDAVARKAHFDEDEACSDIYHAMFQVLFEKEKTRYMNKIYEDAEGELIEGEDYIPFEEHSFYLAL